MMLTSHESNPPKGVTALGGSKPSSDDRLAPPISVPDDEILELETPDGKWEDMDRIKGELAP